MLAIIISNLAQEGNRGRGTVSGLTDASLSAQLLESLLNIRHVC